VSLHRGQSLREAGYSVCPLLPALPVLASSSGPVWGQEVHHLVEENHLEKECHLVEDCHLWKVLGSLAVF
jgi:hypothetical protein